MQKASHALLHAPLRDETPLLADNPVVVELLADPLIWPIEPGTDAADAVELPAGPLIWPVKPGTDAGDAVELLAGPLLWSVGSGASARDDPLLPSSP